MSPRIATEYTNSMKIVLRLLWHKSGAPARRAFRLPGAGELFCEYAGRVDRYVKCEALGGGPEGKRAVWVLDRGGKDFSSEDIAARLEEVKDSGRDLEVVVGGADGLDAEKMRELKPSLIWSFGRLTLPHELAAVAAAEQLYRAWTILANEPYHKGH